LGGVGYLNMLILGGVGYGAGSNPLAGLAEITLLLATPSVQNY